MDFGTASVGIPSPARSLLSELCGVPKPALREVFGNGLGRRIWHQAHNRAGLGTELAAADPKRDPGAAKTVNDQEITSGMIAYLSRCAAEALVRNRRQARAIVLKLFFRDGQVSTLRMSLSRATSDAQRLQQAAVTLFQTIQPRAVPIVAVHLTVLSLQPEAAMKRIGNLTCTSTAAVAT